MLELHSKLPNLGVTIFSTMSALAQNSEQLTCHKVFRIFLLHRN